MRLYFRDLHISKSRPTWLLRQQNSCIMKVDWADYLLTLSTLGRYGGSFGFCFLNGHSNMCFKKNMGKEKGDIFTKSCSSHPVDEIQHSFLLPSYRALGKFLWIFHWHLLTNYIKWFATFMLV